MAFIEIEDLYKSYGQREALRGLDLHVSKGDIYGFLGPNGAGKTTTLKIIMGLIKPDSGSVIVGGKDVSKEGMQIRRYIGYLPERIAFYRDMSIWDNLSFLCDIKECPRDRIYSLLEDFKINAPPETKIKKLSKGMVQRLGLAQTLIGDPELLILDEPTTGLDPEIRHWVKEQIIAMGKRGKTVFLSSHILSDVQQLCNRIGVISNGRMIAEDDVEKLGKKLRLDHRFQLTVRPLNDALKKVKVLEGVKRPRIEDGSLVLYCSGMYKVKVIEHLLQHGFDIQDFNVQEPDLEEVFVKIMEDEK